MSICTAIAEGNALGKGPLVFHLRPPLIAEMRKRAAAGDPEFKALELSMFRPVSSLPPSPVSSLPPL